MGTQILPRPRRVRPEFDHLLEVRGGGLEPSLSGQHDGQSFLQVNLLRKLAHKLAQQRFGRRIVLRAQVLDGLPKLVGRLPRQLLGLCRE